MPSEFKAFTASVMRRQEGFSLVEISVVLVIVGLLLGSIINGMTAYFQNSRISLTKKALDGVERSITGFVIANGRFPCPDFDGDGDEDCGAQSGFLPYAVLGVERTDAWGGPYMYAVDTAYSDNPPGDCTEVPPGCNLPGGCNVTFKLNSPEGIIDVQRDGGVNIATTVAVAYSIGLDNVSQQPNPAALQFSALTYSPPDSAAPFDDIVVWMTSLTIKADMAQAEQLPEPVCP